jgi:hypothetical protein
MQLFVTELPYEASDEEETHTLDNAVEDSVSDVTQQEDEVDGPHALPCASVLSSTPSRLQST